MWIVCLVEAMQRAKVDNTPYGTVMTLKIEFFASDTRPATFSAGGSRHQGRGSLELPFPAGFRHFLFGRRVVGSRD